MSTARDMDALLQSYVDRGLPGCGCAIAQRGKIIYENYFGYSDVENKVALKPDSVFRQYSLSKVPMYATCMILYEKGKFLLSDPLYEYFPEWKNAKKAVTNANGTVDVVPVDKPVLVRDVLNMTCGLPYHMGASAGVTQKAMAKLNKEMREKGSYSLREEIRRIASDVPVAFEPGTQWMYGYGSDLSAGLIAEITGKTPEGAMKEYLFDPLGMDSTGARLFGDIEDRLVKMYYKKPEGLFPFAPRTGWKEFDPDPKAEAGWGRLFSTVGDYIKLTQMLANGGVYNGERVMGRKTIDLMRQNCLDEAQLKSFHNTYLAGYGYGFGVRTLMDRAAGAHNGSIGAFGWTGGSGTWCESDPSEGVSIVYLHNQQPNEEEYYHLHMRAVAYGMIE